MKRLAAKLSAAVLIWVQTAEAAVCYGEAGTGSPDRGLTDSPDKFTGSGSAETFMMIVQVLFFLTVIIGIFFVIVKILAKKSSYFSGRSIRSLGGLPLGQNKSIQVVVIGKSIYIVGVGDNVQLLEKISGEEQVAELTEMMTPGTSYSGPAFGTIGGWLGKLRNKPAADEELEMTETFQQVFQNKMQDMKSRKELMDEWLQQEKNADRLKDQ